MPLWILILVFGYLLPATSGGQRHAIAANRTRRQIRNRANRLPMDNGVNRLLVVPRHARLTDQLDYEEELLLTTPEIIRYRGYPVEEHRVVTEDGYLLTLYRIPSARKGRRVVLLQHGAQASGALWVITPKERSLTFLLADRGYDVWIGNFRGSRPSTEHIRLDPEGPEYWDFSGDEIGWYDMPATINYILGRTGQKKLSFVGNSFGCTVFFIAMITRPELNSKVDIMFAFAPLVTMADMRVPFVRTFAPFWDIAYYFAKRRGAWVVNDLDKDPVQRFLNRRMCKQSYFNAVICRENILPTVGYHRENFDLSLIPALYQHFPTGMSLKTVAHYMQNIQSDVPFFSAYDYGPEENLRRYGNERPMDYDLRLVKCPVVLFWSANDWVVGRKDVEWLENRLGNVRASIQVADPDFTHFDFQFGINAKEMVYDHVFKMLPPP